MYILVTDASVSLKTFDEGNAYLKDSAVTLVCTITPYNNEMTWYVDNDPYAGCFLGTCAPSANKPYTFKFTFDETAGLFNLTIDSVNSSHAELLFACDDGSVRETISFNVTTVTNEGNGDNDDSELSIGAIVGIVLGCVLGLCVGVFAVFLLYKRNQLKKEIKEWIAKPQYCRIIMQEFLKIDTLFETIVKEHRQLFATVRYTGQRRNPLDLVVSTTDARSKMQELVNDSNFSSHIMQDEDFLRFIKRELQRNKALYEAIKEVIGAYSWKTNGGD